MYLNLDVRLGSRKGKNNALTFNQAAEHGEIVFNCIKGEVTLEALRSVEASSLAGKILVDVSNPLDFSEGMPPALLICNKDSLGEQVQALHPGAKVIKAFNTLTADLMVKPSLLNQDHDLFICGNDQKAKAGFLEFLETRLGWKSVIDLGDIKSSRGMEMMLPLWVNLYMNLQTAMFNFKIVKND